MMRITLARRREGQGGGAGLRGRGKRRGDVRGLRREKRTPGLTRRFVAHAPKHQYPPAPLIRNVRRDQVNRSRRRSSPKIAAGPRPRCGSIRAGWAPPWWWRGAPEFTRVPPSSRLVFEGGVGLVVDIGGERALPASGGGHRGARRGTGNRFPAIARGKRGRLTAWVVAAGADRARRGRAPPTSRPRLPLRAAPALIRRRPPDLGRGRRGVAGVGGSAREGSSSQRSYCRPSSTASPPSGRSARSH